MRFAAAVAAAAAAATRLRRQRFTLMMPLSSLLMPDTPLLRHIFRRATQRGACLLSLFTMLDIYAAAIFA